MNNFILGSIFGITMISFFDPTDKLYIPLGTISAALLSQSNEGKAVLVTISTAYIISKLLI